VGKQFVGSDLVDIMVDNINRVRSGDATPGVANAIVNSAAAMLRLAKLQMDYAKLTNSTPSIPLLRTSKDVE